MSKLMSANMMRLKQDKVFWFCVAVMAVIGAVIAIMAGGNAPKGFALDTVFFVYAAPLEFVCAVFCSLFIGMDYSDGAVRNKIVAGRSRTAVYLSNLAVCAVAGLLFICAFILPMLAIGLPRLGGFHAGAAQLLALGGVTVMMTLAVCSVFTLISMLCHNRAVTAVACLGGILALLLLASWVNGRLQEPEFINNYVYTDSAGSMSDLELEPNPDYLSGGKREAFQFVFELLPTGQAMVFMDAEIMAPVMKHLWRLPVLSLAVFMLTTAAGLCLFRKKDLR